MYLHILYGGMKTTQENVINIKVLIVGLGHMGMLHKKYIQTLNLDWDWYDPYVSQPGQLLAPRDFKKRITDLSSLVQYSHIIIAAPTEYHADYLRKLKSLRFEGKILVEKPGILSINDLHLLDTDTVSVGMVERFNPGFEVLKNNLNRNKILNIDFIRCSARPISKNNVSSFIDVGIHDLDLFFQLFDTDDVVNFVFFKNSNTFSLTIQLRQGQIARFIWSNETYHKERMIHVRQSNYNLVCDLTEQIVKKYSLGTDCKNCVEDLYVEKSSPLLRELEYFIKDNKKIDASKTHEFFVKIIEDMILD